MRSRVVVFWVEIDVYFYSIDDEYIIDENEVSNIEENLWNF